MTIKGKLTSVILLVLILSAFQTLNAQETESSDPKFGFGVSLFNLSDYMYETSDEPYNSIYMTMNIGKKFRLEPVFGFILSEGFEQFSIGIGGFGRKSISKFNLLYGLRLGINSNEIEVIAPTLGGEYYFIKNFSIGSEIQLKCLISEYNVVFLTNSNVILRFYF